MTLEGGPRCFLHVPKCAGSSVTRAVIDSVAPGTVAPRMQEGLFWMEDWDPDLLDPNWRMHMVVDDAEMDELAGYDIIMGHFSLPVLQRVTDPSRIVTVLREPRARLLSHYAYWRASSEQPMWRGWSLADYAWRPLDEVLASELVAGEIDNLVCRMLVGDDERIPLHGLIAADDVPAVAARAIEALDTLGFVGLVEFGDAMWRGLSEFFDVSMRPRTENSTADWRTASTAPGIDLEISPRTLELLRARTAADDIVYRHALEAAGHAPDGGQIADAVFANELVRVGNSIGSSAQLFRERAAESEELTRRLDAQATALQASQENLERHREWLDGVEGSVSWRMTAPVRAAKQRLLRSVAGGRRPAQG